MSSGHNASDEGRPAAGPWWRFVPRSKAVGVLALVAGVLLMIQGVYTLAVGDHSTGTTVWEIIISILGLLLIIRSVDGLRVLSRVPSRE